MHSTPCWLLAGLLVACNGEAAPTPTPRQTAAPTARSEPAQPVTGSAPVTGSVAETVATAGGAMGAAGDAGADVRIVAAAQRIIDQAAAADPVQQAKAPAALRALGTAALPALTASLRTENVAARRIAALTLLQWGDDLRHAGAADQVVAALAAARDDADPSVRAAAEHAYRRAVGDTSALDQARAADEAAMRGDH